MKRIAYILVNKEGEIHGETFLENQIFSSKNKAQKQISYWNKHKVSNEQNEEEEWTIKKIVLESYSRLQQHNQFWRDRGPDTALLKVTYWFVSFAVCVGVYGYLTLNPLLGMQADPKIQEILVFNTFLADIAITWMLTEVLKILKRFVFFMWDLNSWIKYKKENTEDLETFHMLPYLLLTKIEEGELISGDLLKMQLTKDNDNESNKKII
ncbi:hypothetical protein LMK05_07155 [Lactococcus petauri]|nr:hypothetical protein LMK05_07155 [Lactococcus petauri]